MVNNFFKKFNEHFSFKLFISFGIMVSFISFLLTGYFLYHMSLFINNSIIKNGMFQVEVLANSLRIGVFSENEDLIDDPVEAIFQHDEVLGVFVFNKDGKLLKKHKKLTVSEINNASKPDKIEKVRKVMHSTYLKNQDGIEFWTPVLSRPDNKIFNPMDIEEIMFLKKEKIIGFVMIKIGKDILIRQFKDILVISIILLSLFLVVAFFASYFLAQKISKPLSILIHNIRMIEKGMIAEKLTIKTKDEIGLLAGAFNDMTASLRKREDDLKAVNHELKLQYEHRKLLSKRLIDLLEKDREQIAMELHDHIGQILISLKLNLEMILGQKESDLSLIKSRIKTSKEQVVHALKDIKQISRGLKPSILDSLGLVSSIKELINEIEFNSSLIIKFFNHEIPKEFGKEKELAIYRITQEALNNIIKHTTANTVFMSLVVKEEKISLSIEDNGEGFDFEKIMKSTNKRGFLGLIIMKERAEQLQGELNIESGIGYGTHLLVEIPF